MGARRAFVGNYFYLVIVTIAVIGLLHDMCVYVGLFPYSLLVFWPCICILFLVVCFIMMLVGFRNQDKDDARIVGYIEDGINREDANQN